MILFKAMKFKGQVNLIAIVGSSSYICDEFTYLTY